MLMGSVSVLLVGDGARNASNLHEHLKRRGCLLLFATCCKEATQLLKAYPFGVVLSEFMLSDGTAYELMPLLRGTEATMFFSNAVEDGCWWMKAIFRGQDRSHEPGMRPREFRVLLDQILYDTCFHIPGSLPANEREESTAVSARLSNDPSQRQTLRSGLPGSHGANSDAQS